MQDDEALAMIQSPALIPLIQSEHDAVVRDVLGMICDTVRRYRKIFPRLGESQASALVKSCLAKLQDTPPSSQGVASVAAQAIRYMLLQRYTLS